MFKTWLLSFVFLIGASLPAVPETAMLINSGTGECPAGSVDVEVYVTADDNMHMRFSYKGTVFAVNIPPMVYALRADGTMAIFNVEDSTENPCDALQLFLGKKTI